MIDKGKMWEFSVRDNGIGLDMEYAENIFVIFSRFHTNEEFSGTGIGLALCKELTERHGGKIRVSSVVGEGAIFAFTLPKAKADKGFKDDAVAVP
ncbi:MAG: light-regulated signal transduction histidine kinase (bacteriophytochrome) [Polyangiales bacterium]